jgi:hypothetical protein
MQYKNEEEERKKRKIKKGCGHQTRGMLAMRTASQRRCRDDSNAIIKGIF